MPLTKSEMEAKLAALEDRISVLSQGTDTLETRFEQWETGWNQWAAQLRQTLVAIATRLEHLGKTLPPPPPR